MSRSDHREIVGTPSSGKVPDFPFGRGGGGKRLYPVHASPGGSPWWI